MPAKVNFRGSRGHRKQSIYIPRKLVENIVHRYVGVDLYIDQQLGNPYHCEVEDEGDHYLRVQLQYLCRVATNCHQQLQDLYKEELEEGYEQG